MEKVQIGTMVQYITAPATDRDGTQWQAQTFPATVVGWVGDKLDLVVIESGHYPSPVIITRTSNVVPYETGKAGWRPIPAGGGAGTTFEAATNAIADDLARNLRSVRADKSAVEGENKGLRVEIGALKDERDSLNVIIREQAVTMDEYRKERSGGMAKIAVLKDDNAALRAQNDGLIDAYKRIDAQVIRLRGETCRACSSEVAARDSEIKSLRDDNERLVKNVNALVKQVHDLADANARIAKMASDDDATWSARVRDLKGDYKAIVDRLNKSNENLRVSNDRLFALTEALEQEIKVIRKQESDRLRAEKNPKPGVPTPPSKPDCFVGCVGPDDFGGSDWPLNPHDVNYTKTLEKMRRLSSDAALVPAKPAVTTVEPEK